MIGANKKKSDFATPYTVSNALTKGGAAVKLSALIMGLGNIAHKQIIKGLIFLAIEIWLYYCLWSMQVHIIFPCFHFIRMEKTGRGI